MEGLFQGRRPARRSKSLSNSFPIAWAALFWRRLIDLSSKTRTGLFLLIEVNGLATALKARR